MTKEKTDHEKHITTSNVNFALRVELSNARQLMERVIDQMDQVIQFIEDDEPDIAMDLNQCADELNTYLDKYERRNRILSET